MTVSGDPLGASREHANFPHCMSPEVAPSGGKRGAPFVTSSVEIRLETHSGRPRRRVSKNVLAISAMPPHPQSTLRTFGKMDQR